MKKRVILTLLLCMTMLFCNYVNAQAANDDPGAARLSGDAIPAEFFDESQTGTLPSYGLSKYGANVTKSPYTSLLYTHQPQFDGRTIINGIDVSVYQKNIDWNKVKAAGIDFAFIRVGYRGYGSSGTLNESTKDTYYEKNMAGAIAAGVKVGVYVFSQAITEAEAIEEADYILNHLGNYTVTMPLILDYEYAGTGLGRLYNAKLSKEEATNICLAFCNRIASAGYTPMVYANPSMFTSQVNPTAITDAGYPIWLAHYTANTAYKGSTFNFWQYSSTGKVDGITGNVDMNFYYALPEDDFDKKEAVANPDGSLPLDEAVILPIQNQYYTGKGLSPAPSVYVNGQLLRSGIDYTVAYTNNINPGTATVTVTGIGEYTGTISENFIVEIAPVASVSLKKRSSSYITINWPKNSVASGYQVYRSTSLNGTYKCFKTISGGATTTYKNKNLTAGKCYYYKVRNFTNIGGQTYYGNFSPVIAISAKINYTRVAIVKDATTIYSDTALNSEILAHPPMDAVLSVEYSTKDPGNNTWYAVTYKENDITYQGFVRAAPVAIAKQAKIANGTNVNIRKAPGVTQKRVTKLKRNKKIYILSSKKKDGVTWYEIQFKKNSKVYNGWVSSAYVKIQ